MNQVYEALLVVEKEDGGSLAWEARGKPGARQARSQAGGEPPAPSPSAVHARRAN